KSKSHHNNIHTHNGSHPHNAAKTSPSIGIFPPPFPSPPDDPPLHDALAFPPPPDSSGKIPDPHVLHNSSLAPRSLRSRLPSKSLDPCTQGGEADDGRPGAGHRRGGPVEVEVGANRGAGEGRAGREQKGEGDRPCRG